VAYEAGGRLPPPRFEKFRASSSCSKILKDKKYFNTVKNFRAISVFQGKGRLFKILNDKKYIFSTVNSGHTVFQGKHKLLKNPECKNYIQYSENFQGKFCFQGKRKFLKNPCFNAEKIFRANCGDSLLKKKNSTRSEKLRESTGKFWSECSRHAQVDNLRNLDLPVSLDLLSLSQ